MRQAETVAALFVERHGVYADLPGVDVWHDLRDARTYEGPFPVVAHPPCARWSRLARRVRIGEDGGCFAAALRAIETWGGVLEHPEGSHAWRHFGIKRPHRHLGWVRAGRRCALGELWTCSVEQGHYGHLARKPTWLLWAGRGRPLRVASGVSDASRKLVALSERQRSATPPAFRDALLELARTCLM